MLRVGGWFLSFIFWGMIWFFVNINYKNRMREGLVGCIA